VDQLSNANSIAPYQRATPTHRVARGARLRAIRGRLEPRRDPRRKCSRPILRAQAIVDAGLELSEALSAVASRATDAALHAGQALEREQPAEEPAHEVEDPGGELLAHLTAVRRKRPSGVARSQRPCGGCERRTTAASGASPSEGLP
jgi:hypothetical protein